MMRCKIYEYTYKKLAIKITYEVQYKTNIKCFLLKKNKIKHKIRTERW